MTCEVHQLWHVESSQPIVAIVTSNKIMMRLEDDTDVFYPGVKSAWPDRYQAYQLIARGLSGRLSVCHPTQAARLSQCKEIPVLPAGGGFH